MPASRTVHDASPGLMRSNSRANFIVQSPGQTMLAGLTGPGVPGHGTGIPGFFETGCRGFSNPDNPPSP